MQCPRFGADAIWPEGRAGGRGVWAPAASVTCATGAASFFRLFRREIRTVFLPPPPLSTPCVIGLPSITKKEVWLEPVWTGRWISRLKAQGETLENHVHMVTL